MNKRIAAPSPREVKKVERVRMPILDMVDGYRPFLVGCKPEENVGIVTQLRGTVVGAALSHKDVFKAHNLEIPVRRVMLEELAPCYAEMQTLEGNLPGTLLQLPGSLTQAVLFFQALEEGKSRHFDWFIRDYGRALNDEMAQLVSKYALRTRTAPGLQAQADIDLRLAMNEVGISLWAARLFAPLVGLKAMQLDGLKVVVSRSPVASSKGTRRAILRVLPVTHGRKLHFHPYALKALHAGDIDGDVTYLACDGEDVPEEYYEL